MRSVSRSLEPDFFTELRATYARWEDLNGQDRGRIRAKLIQDFGEICAYCQQLCYPPRPSGLENPNDESIDHFRPRNNFQNLWLDWLNLIYACRLCNQNKGGKWPGSGDRYDALTNQWLSNQDFRYNPPTEYAIPNQGGGTLPAEEFFDFDVSTGAISPSARLSPQEWSIANRTIWDLDLDSKQLRDLRLERLNWLIEKLETVKDFDEKLNVMLRFMLPKMPFSRFIYAYVTARFPLIERISR